jgi:hypothetical protein
MRAIYLFFALFLTTTPLFGQKKTIKVPTQKIMGDLVFQAVQFTYFEGDDKHFGELDSLIDNDRKNDKMLGFLRELRSLGLHKTPHIRLKQDDRDDRYSILFMDWESYNDLKYKHATWDCWTLKENGKKVGVTAEVKLIHLKSIPVPVYQTVKPPKFEIVDGKMTCY